MRICGHEENEHPGLCCICGYPIDEHPGGKIYCGIWHGDTRVLVRLRDPYEPGYSRGAYRFSYRVTRSAHGSK